jgi:hypothetical protein
LENEIKEVDDVEYTLNNWYSRESVEVDYVDWFVIYTKTIIPRGYKNIKVTFKKWFATVPKDIETFFMKYVWKLIEQQKPATSNQEIKSKKIDGLSVSFFGPDELANRDGAFAVDYEVIKNKYRVFSFHVI